MRNLLTVNDIKGVSGFRSATLKEETEYLIKEANYLKANRFADKKLGENKTMLLVFFNSSLRTRLSTQKAAMNLGLQTMVLDINQGAWKLESEKGAIMDGDRSEHILEAIPVMASFCDIIGVRSFAGLTNRNYDYAETILNQFIELSGKPVISMESATRHPMQALADLITIEEFKETPKPKIVMSWAPHPKALPQAVPNSFAEWAIAAGYDLTIAQPRGYELNENITKGAKIEYDQDKALEGADFVYAKNWAAYSGDNYGKVLIPYSREARDSWTITSEKMALTDNAYFMHCLPVRRNVVVTDRVIQSPTSLVIAEAANREISAQTIIKEILKGIK